MSLELILIIILFFLFLAFILLSMKYLDLKNDYTEIDEILNKYYEEMTVLKDTNKRYQDNIDVFLNHNYASIEEIEKMLKVISNSYSVSNSNKLTLLKLLFITLNSSPDTGIKDLRINSNESISKTIDIIKSKLEGDTNITDKEIGNAILALIFHTPKSRNN